MDNNSIKENLKRYRKKAGKTQSVMAEELGMSRMAYINIEKAGKTALVNEDLDRIAGILNTSAEEILLGDTRGMLMERIEELEKALEEQKRVLEEQRVRYGESMRAKDDIIRMLMERSE